MGVDVSYLYGYGAEINEIEWDINYLKEKYKNKLNEYVNPKREHIGTWAEFIFNLSEVAEDEDGGLAEILEDLDFLFDLNYDGYDGDNHLTFNHNHIAKIYPDTKLKDLDETAKLYAKELGIKNVEVIRWIEWGYFS